ncbi:helix-turn-helix domain-containing protein [Subtercola boreus]|nr:helix-turn-helix domain-containing protein [Subtercola boreus]
MADLTGKMDKTTVRAEDGRMAIAEGFPGQRLQVLPRPMIVEALSQPGTSHLVATDCGYFPEARAHGMSRSAPIDQAVVLICTSGRGWCRIDETTHGVEQNQVVVIPPGTSHAYASDTSDPWTLWWLHVDGRDLHEFLVAARMTASAPVRTLDDTYRVVSLAEEVLQQMERDISTASLLLASGAAWHLLAVLASSATSARSRMSVIDEARDYLRSHLTERISIGHLAERATLSPSHFAALFREQVGFPVLKYQTQMRMARARELLDTTDMPIATIANTVGYQDEFYFSRQFRTVHGTTALRYRAQHKG